MYVSPKLMWTNIFKSQKYAKRTLSVNGWSMLTGQIPTLHKCQAKFHFQWFILSHPDKTTRNLNVEDITNLNLNQIGQRENEWLDVEFWMKFWTNPFSPDFRSYRLLAFENGEQVLPLLFYYYLRKETENCICSVRHWFLCANRTDIALKRFFRHLTHYFLTLPGFSI